MLEFAKASIDLGFLPQICVHAGPSVDRAGASALKHCKLDGFSVERLMALLGRDVEIVVRKKPRLRAKACLSVVAA